MISSMQLLVSMDSAGGASYRRLFTSYFLYTGVSGFIKMSLCISGAFAGAGTQFYTTAIQAVAEYGL